ncbi:hypothetical protein EVAR_16903_1 [Eumeta japonica]|uniref:Uncharacterized protein n=1 Tax=Eumeta variegata TaxID=151549 RepID=A0A4C1TV94_EUMVA|nr:hypothetical protein EVAR_16903_1 [Eumeta japonica]
MHDLRYSRLKHGDRAEEEYLRVRRNFQGRRVSFGNFAFKEISQVRSDTRSSFPSTVSPMVLSSLILKELAVNPNLLLALNSDPSTVPDFNPDHNLDPNSGSIFDFDARLYLNLDPECDSDKVPRTKTRVDSCRDDGRTPREPPNKKRPLSPNGKCIRWAEIKDVRCYRRRAPAGGGRREEHGARADLPPTSAALNDKTFLLRLALSLSSVPLRWNFFELSQDNLAFFVQNLKDSKVIQQLTVGKACALAGSAVAARGAPAPGPVARGAPSEFIVSPEKFHFLPSHVLCARVRATTGSHL